MVRITASVNAFVHFPGASFFCSIPFLGALGRNRTVDSLALNIRRYQMAVCLGVLACMSRCNCNWQTRSTHTQDFSHTHDAQRPNNYKGHSQYGKSTVPTGHPRRRSPESKISNMAQSCNPLALSTIFSANGSFSIVSLFAINSSTSQCAHK